MLNNLFERGKINEYHTLVKPRILRKEFVYLLINIQKMKTPFQILEQAAKEKLKEMGILPPAEGKPYLPELLIQVYGSETEDYLGYTMTNKGMIEEILFDLTLKNKETTELFLEEVLDHSWALDLAESMKGVTSIEKLQEILIEDLIDPAMRTRIEGYPILS